MYALFINEYVYAKWNDINWYVQLLSTPIFNCGKVGVGGEGGGW